MLWGVFGKFLGDLWYVWEEIVSLKCKRFVKLREIRIEDFPAGFY